jgi:hypothetical protein
MLGEKEDHAVYLLEKLTTKYTGREGEHLYSTISIFAWSLEVGGFQLT